jgi:hypothetical protein
MNCIRCGIEISDGAVERRKARGTFDGRCQDCRGHRSTEVKYDGEPCRPWRGEVDEDLNPIDRNLKPYLPGVRTCGHKDCVNKQHIIKPLGDLELERLDISYRTGKKTTWEDLYKESA